MWALKLTSLLEKFHEVSFWWESSEQILEKWDLVFMFVQWDTKMYFSLFEDRVLLLVQVGLELGILLPLPPSCRSYGMFYHAWLIQRAVAITVEAPSLELHFRTIKMMLSEYWLLRLVLIWFDFHCGKNTKHNVASKSFLGGQLPQKCCVFLLLYSTPPENTHLWSFSSLA